MHRARSMRARTARSSIGVVLTACAVVALVACSSDEDAEDATTTSSTTTTAPIPAPGGQQVSQIDVCERFGAEAEAFLAAADQGPVVQQQGDASEVASVCAWFLEELDAERPANLLLRVEPVRVEGNFLCEQRDEVPAEELEPEAGPPGWISTSAPIEAAIEGNAWCVYARAPEPVQPSDEVTAAMARLLSDMESMLPS